MRQFRVICADVFDGLAQLPDDSIETCITDPPYGLSFMGKAWDGCVPDVPVWREVLRVLKPGAMLLAFGGTRTYHRLTCAIEDAGFEIRDCMMWLYGSGFPKSFDISKAIDKSAGAERRILGPGINAAAKARHHAKRGGVSDGSTYYGVPDGPTVTAPATGDARTWQGYGTALKPAWEPIIVAMKPCDGTFANNALEHGVAGFNIDGGRIDHGGDIASATSAGSGAGYDAHNAPDRKYGNGLGGIVAEPHAAGRWPANVILDEQAAAMLDRQTAGQLHSPGIVNPAKRGTPSGPVPYGGYGDSTTFDYGDSGGASRFFYTSKASAEDRNAGLPDSQANRHPTVKPLDLMQYLCKLTRTPTGGTVLDPFAGSGSTGVAALREGRNFIGIEIDPETATIARERMAGDAPMFNREQGALPSVSKHG